MIYSQKATVQRLAKVSSFFTQNRHGYSVKFSPFDSSCLAVATSQHFGFVGSGTLFLLQIGTDGSIVETKSFEWSDGLFDIAWSEQCASTLVSACGDGGIQLWNIDADVDSTLSGYNKPKSIYREHSKEVCSVDWSRSMQTCLFLSSSWDCTIKLWNPEYLSALCTYRSHSDLVYNAKFAKHVPNVFASVSADGYLKLWDFVQPQPITSILAHRDSEVLSCDWSEQNQHIIATGGSDGMIKGWDLRFSAHPLFELYGCSSAVRRVRFSPFDDNYLATVSYDSSTRIWNWQQSSEAIETIAHHSEFNYGLDWNRSKFNQIADCGWDSLVHVYSAKLVD